MLKSSAEWKLERSSAALLSIAAAWGMALGIGAFALPSYGASTSISSDGPNHAFVVHTATGTLVEVNGLKVLVPVMLPLVGVALAACALRRRRRHWNSHGGAVAWSITAVVFGLTLLGALTIGVFIAPIAALLLAACATATKRPPMPVDPAWPPPLFGQNSPTGPVPPVG
jgi:hypothetical protein